MMKFLVNFHDAERAAKRDEKQPNKSTENNQVLANRPEVFLLSFCSLYSRLSVRTRVSKSLEGMNEKKGQA